MKNPRFIILHGVIAMLLLAGCSGEDYDPSASGSDHAAIQGKAIQEPPANQLSSPSDLVKAKTSVQGNVSSIEGTSGESTGSLEINTLATSDSKVDDTLVAENEIGNDRSLGTVSEKTTNPLIGQTLPEVQPAEDTIAGETATSPAPEPQNSQLPPLPKDSPYKEVSFRALSSFPYDVEWATDGKEPDPSAFLKRVPPEVRKLSGAKVAVEGFMIPTMVNEENKVTEFLLLPDQMSCCYGKNPAANGWVVVNAKGIDIMMDKIIRVTGSMFVEERWDEEFFEGLYHLTCEKVTGPAL